MSIPLFDSLTHPTPSGNWFPDSWYRKHGYHKTITEPCAEFRKLGTEMDQANIVHSLAVGMGSECGGYQEATYAELVRQHLPNSFPIAYCDLMQWDTTVDALNSRIVRLRSMGYRGLKLHPRLGGFDFTSPRLLEVMRIASAHDFPVLLCTYPYGRGCRIRNMSLESLIDLLVEVDEPKIVLLHGGVTDILKWAEALRGYEKVVLDISLTLVRFQNSSLDIDIKYLFNTFDRRMCCGSDHPQYSPATFRDAFDRISEGVSEEKARNVGYRNLTKIFCD